MTEKPKTKKKTVKNGNANNVLPFPKTDVTTEITLEKLKEYKDTMRELHIEETIDAVVPMLFDNINLMGFNFTKKVELAKDINLVFESVNSLLRKYYDMEHPLQDIAEQLTILPSEQE